MITSKYEFFRRYLRRYVDQRLLLPVLGRAFHEGHREDLGISGPEDIAEVNGILVTCWRGATGDGWSWGIPEPLHRLRLELRDVLVNGHTLFAHLPRRRSRKENKEFNRFRIALNDIVWPASSDNTTGGFCSGVAGFLAGGFPAPETLPDDQKTQVRLAAEDPEALPPAMPAPEAKSLGTLESGVGRSGSGVVRGDPQATELYMRSVAWFRECKTRRRYGPKLREDHAVLYDSMINALRAGVPFRKLMGIMTDVLAKQGKDS